MTSAGLTAANPKNVQWQIDATSLQWRLAAAGDAGVTRALEILRADIERTLRLLGCNSVHALDQSYVETPGTWSRNRKPEH